MKRIVVLTLFLCAFAFISPALAVDLGVGVRAGTYGVGAEFGVGVTKWFGVRAVASGIDLSSDYEETDVIYDGDLKLGGYGVMADFFPMRGTFRLTAGLLANRNEIGLTAMPTGPIDIGNDTYDPSEVGVLSGNVQFRDTAGYFGVGWGNVARGKRLGFLADIGVVAQGSGQVSLASSAGLVDPADLAAEAASIEDDIDGYDLWPVVSFGLAIRF